MTHGSSLFDDAQKINVHKDQKEINVKAVYWEA